jgi:hypothetical protein
MMRNILSEYGIALLELAMRLFRLRSLRTGVPDVGHRIDASSQCSLGRRACAEPAHGKALTQCQVGFMSNGA